MKTIGSTIGVKSLFTKNAALLIFTQIMALGMLAAPASAMPVAFNRVVRIAGSILPQLSGLLLVCVVVGLTMASDRRRRARARSSAA